MTVTVDGEQLYTWPVSTGRPGYDTPSGKFRANRMDATHKSQEYDNAPMPHTVFFDWHGHALHGFLNTSQIGNPASHGCVRMQPEKAALLYSLIAMRGMKDTSVIITGKTPSWSDILKDRRHSLVQAKAELPVLIPPHNGELSALYPGKEPSAYIQEAALLQDLSSDYEKLLPPPPFRPFGTQPPNFRLPPAPEAQQQPEIASVQPAAVQPVAAQPAPVQAAAVKPQPFRPFGTKPPAYLEQAAASVEPQKQRVAAAQPPVAKAQQTAMVELTDEAAPKTAVVQPVKASVQPQSVQPQSVQPQSVQPPSKGRVSYGPLEYNRQLAANYGRPVYYYVVPAYQQPRYYMLVMPRDAY